jgi:hypothetical protein
MSDEKSIGASSTATAWTMIGWDDGKFRVKGGRVEYETVIYSARRNPARVTLARLEPSSVGLRQINRRVDPDTVLEFCDPDAFAKYCQEFDLHPAKTPDR